MIDHIKIYVNDIEESKEFYLKALEPIHYKLMVDMSEYKAVGLGSEGVPSTWLHGTGCKQPTHIAWTAETREQVDVFHKAAVEAGGKDNGAPGIREEYHKDYYGAFIIDPNGHNIEVVCHKV